MSSQAHEISLFHRAGAPHRTAGVARAPLSSHEGRTAVASALGALVPMIGHPVAYYEGPVLAGSVLFDESGRPIDSELSGQIDDSEYVLIHLGSGDWCALISPPLAAVAPNLVIDALTREGAAELSSARVRSSIARVMEGLAAARLV